MPKTCQYSKCTSYQFGGGYCKFHQYLRTDKKSSKLKEISHIKPISNKRIEDNKLYHIIREEFLRLRPLCEAKLEDCTRISTDIHHKQGRNGKNFLDVQTWLSVCRNCHHWIEEHPKEAKELNLSQSRLNR